MTSQPPPTPARPSPPAGGPAAITSEQLQAWMTRRQRARGRIKAAVAILLAAVVAVFAIFWTCFHQQLSAQGQLNSAGFTVEWDLDWGNLLRGGRSTAAYSPRWYWISSQKFDTKELEPLKSLRHLEMLDISALTTLTEEELAILSELPELVELQINRNPTYRGQMPLPLGDRMLETIKGLKKLKILGLSDNRITDAGLVKLANLTALETLDLDGTLVSDNGLETLKQFGNLKHLRLERTAVTRAGVAEFQRVMPGVEVSFEKAIEEFQPQ